ncbi:heme exporter protein CcmB [Dehalococcoidia bacterium]|nr:heme exporter protein CcmB [Dehalococcoidia bacterium]
MPQPASPAMIDKNFKDSARPTRQGLQHAKDWLLEYLFQVKAMLWKDLAIELRTRDVLASMIVFGLLSLTVFNFAFDLRGDNVLVVAPGVIWVSILFAGMLGLGRSYSHERDRGSMEGLLLCPVDRSAIYVAKFLATLFFLLIFEIVLLPVSEAFFVVPVLKGTTITVILLGTIGFASVGAVFGAMAVNTRAREVMLPVLLLPILMPLIIGMVKATGILMDGQPWSEVWTWVMLLVTIDVVYFVLSFILYDFVIEDWD